MNSPSSYPRNDLEGLSQAQITFLEQLFIAGENGMDWTSCFNLSHTSGITEEEFDRMTLRGLIIPANGRFYHRDNFRQSA
jgi:hypothetical protein